MMFFSTEEYIIFISSIFLFYCIQIYKNLDDLLTLNYALEGGLEGQKLW
jgi:hypothetical protein